MAPVALVAVWLGGAYFAALTLAAAAVMAWEWARLCGGGTLGRIGAGVTGMVTLAVLGAAFHGVYVVMFVLRFFLLERLFSRLAAAESGQQTRSEGL